MRVVRVTARSLREGGGGAQDDCFLRYYADVRAVDEMCVIEMYCISRV
jgi:hypothetical protein